MIEKGANINAKDTALRTALHSAGTVEVAKTLVEHGADIEAVDYKGRTPLIIQSVNSRVDIVKYLIEKGANKETKNNYDKTAYEVTSNTMRYYFLFFIYFFIYFCFGC